MLRGLNGINSMSNKHTEARTESSWLIHTDVLLY